MLINNQNFSKLTLDLDSKEKSKRKSSSALEETAMLASQQQLPLSIILLFERSLNLRDNAPIALGAQRQLREAAAHRRWVEHFLD